MDWESRFSVFIRDRLPADDPAHDLAHIERVVANAHSLAEAEGADLNVVLPAAWLHDCVVVPKDSPDRSRASRLAAAAAITYLVEASYPSAYLPAIRHAIEAHSFSAGITPETLEAKIIQDADRLDAIGAIGIARCLMLGGVMGKPLYNVDEPFPHNRLPDDSIFTVDHFYVKLLKLADLMHTAAGQREGRRRTRFMQVYLSQLEHEVGGGGFGLPGLSAS